MRAVLNILYLKILKNKIYFMRNILRRILEGIIKKRKIWRKKAQKKKKVKEKKKKTHLLKVKDIMSVSIIKVRPEMSLSRVLGIFKKWKISGAPVFEGKKLVGEISKTDILRVVKKLDENELTDADIKILQQKRVKNYMKKPIGISENASIEKAIEAMRKYNISRLLVFNRNKKLVGIITRTDLMKALLKTGSERRIYTQIDEMVEMIEEKKVMSLDKIAKKLKLPLELVEDWAKILEEQKMIKLEYPPVGSPIVKVVKPLEE